MDTQKERIMNPSDNCILKRIILQMDTDHISINMANSLGTKLFFPWRVSSGIIHKGCERL
jgi:hypothetical protein